MSGKTLRRGLPPSLGRGKTLRRGLPILLKEEEGLCAEVSLSLSLRKRQRPLRRVSFFLPKEEAEISAQSLLPSLKGVKRHAGTPNTLPNTFMRGSPILFDTNAHCFTYRDSLTLGVRKAPEPCFCQKVRKVTSRERTRRQVEVSSKSVKPSTRSVYYCGSSVCMTRTVCMTGAYIGV